MAVDVHNYKRQLELSIKRIRESQTISDKNKKAILNFVDDCLADGITMGRISRCITDLKNINRLLGMDFDTATINDIKSTVARIEQEDWKDWTKYGIKVTIKKFYKWLFKSEEYPDAVRWIKPRIKNGRIKMPEDLMTEDDIKRLVDVAKNPRDKAFIMTLYESGCRIGELLPIKLKHIQFDNYGAQLMVDGKTGQRRVRVIAAAPYLTEWINKHPKRVPDSEVWFGNRNTGIKYCYAVNLLRNLAVKAEMSKHVNPHSFRHSRATYLANHLTEAQMKEHFGWVQGSDMASVYVHLSGRDVDTALLKTYGISTNNGKKEESELKPRECPRCKEVNAITNQFCSKCGMIVDEQARNKIIENDFKMREANAVMDKLLKDNEFLEMFKAKVKEVSKDSF